MDTERHAMALLCEHLPTLREQAEAGRWADLLEMHVNEVAEGAAAVAACEQLGLLGPDWIVRGELEGARMEGLAPVRLVGDYRCPRRRCVRQAERDDQGRPPLCTLMETPMVFQTRR